MIYINVQNLITLLILRFKTWKCAQNVHHPSKYFTTYSQSLKMRMKSCWKFLLSQFFPSQNPSSTPKTENFTFCIRLTWWCLIKFIVSDLLFLYKNLWSSGVRRLVTRTTTRYWVRIPIFTKFKFLIFNFLEVLGHPGQYIDTFWHEIPSATWFSGCSNGLLIVRFSVRSCGGRIEALDQPREAS